ncbi:MAG: dihydroorotase [Gammaproteobacteria bacterium]|nr:dihydroorotase [Gammaproteobacteria bacterium]
MSETLRIKRPDDWHLHLRDGEALKTLVPISAGYCQRAVVMPNLVPPVTTVAAAKAYRDRVMAALPDGQSFNPLMTLYMTQETDAAEVRAASACDEIIGIKLYPAGATTNSASGVTDIRRLEPIFETMADYGLPLLVHGEVTTDDADIFDREARFIDEILEPLVNRVANLKVVLEHISCRNAVEFVNSRDKLLGATITPQHLYMNRNAMLTGGIRPHNYCLPVLKREEDRQALIAAATSGDQRFFMGTDSAPHVREAKESDCGCAGTFNAPVALAVYAEVFEDAGALDKLEAFTSSNGPRFYGLPENADHLTLKKNSWRAPAKVGSGNQQFVPWLAGESLRWQVTGT